MSVAALEPRREQTERGVAAITAPDLRWCRCDIKSVNLLANVLAAQRASEAGAFEAILIRDESVTEATRSNVFALIDGTLRTHPTGPFILPGVTREVVMELCAKVALRVREEAITRNELTRVEELFVTGTTSDVMPVVTLDGRPVGSGRPGPLTSLAGDEYAHSGPQFLPDGEHFLYLAEGAESSELRVASLTSGEATSLGRSEPGALYVAGYLLSARGANLSLQPFDPGTRRLIGSPSIVVPGFTLNHTTGVFSVSATGTLAYQKYSTDGALTWLDRNGATVNTVESPGTFTNIDLSPDGRYVAAARWIFVRGARPEIDLWRLDLERSGLATRLTDHPGLDFDPDWSPDGRQIAFGRSPSPGQPNALVVRPSGPGGDETTLWNSGNIFAPEWSHDGRFIIYSEGWGPGRTSDLWLLPLTGERKPAPFLRTSHSERGASFSPDDRWVAYESNASGRFEVYVRPFPARTGEFQDLSDAAPTAPKGLR